MGGTQLLSEHFFLFFFWVKEERGFMENTAWEQQKNKTGVVVSLVLPPNVFISQTLKNYTCFFLKKKSTTRNEKNFLYLKTEKEESHLHSHTKILDRCLQGTEIIKH